MGSNVFGIGFGELLFLAILALIIFGPKRIPEVARTIGRLIQQVRQATSGIEKEVRQLMGGEGDPSTWLKGGPPSQTPPRPAPKAEPYAPFVPPQGRAQAAQPAPAAGEPGEGQGHTEETALPAPARPEGSGEPDSSPPAPTSLSG